MRSDPRFFKLIEEFPELANDEITIEKELYAHFGLLFFSFALVEHSLINFVVFDAAGQGLQNRTIRNRTEWEAAFDQNYEKAKSLSLGNLIRATKDIPELVPVSSSLTKMKTERDYFAHHFFRDEAIYFRGDDRGWLLLLKLNEVRQRTVKLENQLKPQFELMCGRYGLPRPTADQLAQILNEYENDISMALAQGNVQFGWES